MPDPEPQTPPIPGGPSMRSAASGVQKPNFWLCSVLSVCAGFASATLGIGGGVILVPALAMWFRLPLAQAIAISVGTTVFSAGCGAAAETIFHPENIHWDYCFILLAGALAGVWVGQRLRGVIPERVILWAFAAIMLLSALKLVGAFSLLGAQSEGMVDAWIGGAGLSAESFPALTIHFAAVVLLGFVGGMSSPLFGLGGGVIFVPGLAALFAQFSSVHAARGTSLGAVCFTSLYAAFLQWKAGSMRLDWLRRMIPGAIAGAVVGMLAANRLDAAVLRWMIAVFVVFSAGRMLLGSRSSAPAPDAKAG